jgi:hypothetical protein
MTGPWDPGPPPKAQPGVPVPTPPGGTTLFGVRAEPEPVPYSGRAITDVTSCRILPHTWFYKQTVFNNTGKKITVTERENFFDGRFVSKGGGFTLEANQSITLDTRWCSGYPTFHYAQTRFKARDEEGNPLTLSGPWVRLQPK